MHRPDWYDSPSLHAGITQVEYLWATIARSTDRGYPFGQPPHCGNYDP
jgi:hypothetical protein